MKETILHLLDNLGIKYRWEDHEAVFTVKESLALLDKQLPTKNLVLQDKTGRTIMVIMHGITRLDTKLISQELNTKKLNFAKPDVLMEKLGVTPGSVSVFGLLNDNNNDIEVILDSNILSDKEVGFHPNDNTASIFFKGSELKKIIEATGHDAIVMNLGN
ncbi:MAG: prolyl-tRNA synthetase associated domain-containing protein [Acidimicrobiia bacterium]